MVEQIKDKRSFMAFIIQNLWLIIGAIFVLIVGGGWWFFSSGSFQRFRDWTSPSSDKFIKAKLFCEDKQIRDRKLKVETYCISDEKKMAGYHLVHDLLITGAGTGRQFLAINERDSFPISFGKQLTPEKRKQYPTAQRVYIDTANDIDSREAGDSARNFMGMSLSIIALAGALVFVVLAIIIFWKTRGG